MSVYPAEEIYEVYWDGPFTLKQLEQYASEESDLAKNWSLYAKYEDHPLYGRNILSYVGMASDQKVFTRLTQHNLDKEQIYVGIIFRFESWEDSTNKWEEDWNELSDYIVRDKPTIEAIEALLIFALWPAGNVRNRKSANGSWKYRLFNTGNTGAIPNEISGHYTFEKLPKTLEIEQE